MFKNKEKLIFGLYVLSIILMAVLYFTESDIMITSSDFRGMLIGHFSILKRLIPGDYNWGLIFLAGFTVYCLIILIRNRKARTRPPSK
jgi:hypothetical protein